MKAIRSFYNTHKHFLLHDPTPTRRYLDTVRSYRRARNANLSNGHQIQQGFSGSKNRASSSPKESTDSSSREKAFSINGMGLEDIVGSMKKGKREVRGVRKRYGYSVNRELEISETMVRSWLPKDAGDEELVRLTDVKRGINNKNYRIPLFGPLGNEVSMVLGGGLVPGSLVLISGDPGVGKSTLLLQMAASISEGHDSDEPASSVVYISGEESVEQISSRAERMKIGADQLYLYSGTDIEELLEKLKPLSIRALIVDSIQTVYLKEVHGSAGGLSQIRQCASALLRFAKITNIPVLLVGHVTKSGDIAGPRVLQHIVDAVLYLEGEKYSSLRLLRSLKNRFGSTDELGVFQMSQLGLQAVSNPCSDPRETCNLIEQNSADSKFLVGRAVAVIMDGSRRAFLVETQALCVSGLTGNMHGVRASRAQMIITVLAKQVGLRIEDCEVSLNVVSGVSLKEAAGDLAIAVSICSSFLGFRIPNGVAFIGEIGLGGELRMVPKMEKRVSTVTKLGYKKCVVPISAMKSLANLDCGSEMEIIGCKDLKDVIKTVFSEHWKRVANHLFRGYA